MLFQSENRFVGFVVPSGGGSSESGECSSRGQPAPEQPWMATSPCPRKQRLTCWGAVDRVAGQVSRLLSPCSPTPGFQDHRLEVNSLHHWESVASGYSCGGLKVACAGPGLASAVAFFSSLHTRVSRPINCQVLSSLAGKTGGASCCNGFLFTKWRPDNLRPSRGGGCVQVSVFTPPTSSPATHGGEHQLLGPAPHSRP